MPNRSLRSRTTLETVKHHKLYVPGQVEFVPALGRVPGKDLAEAHFLADFFQSVDVTEVLAFHNLGVFRAGAAEYPKEPLDDAIDILGPEPVQLAHMGNDARAGLSAPGRVPPGLADLHAAVGFAPLAACGNSHEHGDDIYSIYLPYFQSMNAQ